MGAKDDRGEVGGKEAEEDVGCRVVIVRGETVGRCDGVEVRVVEVADVGWGVGMKYESVDVILEDLAGISCL